MDIREYESPTFNPYWEEVRVLGGPSKGESWRPSFSNYYLLLEEGGTSAQSLERYHKARSREQLVSEYSFAIPDPLTLEFLSEKIPQGSKIVEYGAKTGYWADQLSQLGFTLEAYAPADSGASGRFFPVVEADVSTLSQSSADILFLCWPPLNDPLAFDALQAFKGDTLIYIGEDSFGCTADESFFDALEDWEIVDYFQILSYDLIHDSLTIFKRLS